MDGIPDVVYDDILELRREINAGTHKRKNLWAIEDGGEFRIEEYFPEQDENRCLFRSCELDRVVCDLLNIRLEDL